MPDKQHPPSARTPVLFALVVALLLTGCSTVLPTRQGKTVHAYLLDWQPAAQAAQAAPQAPALMISPTRAASGFGSSDLIYVRQAHQLERYTRHRWVDSPPRMLDPLLVKAAEASGLFSAVAAPGSPINADLRLDSQLLQLQQHIRNDESQVEMVVRFSLVDIRGGRQLAAETFHVSEPAAASPYEGIKAVNRAVARLMAELTAFLGRHSGSR